MTSRWSKFAFLEKLGDYRDFVKIDELYKIKPIWGQPWGFFVISALAESPKSKTEKSEKTCAVKNSMKITSFELLLIIFESGESSKPRLKWNLWLIEAFREFI